MQRMSGCHEREAWDDDLTSQAQRPYGDLEGDRAIAHRDAVLDAEAGRNCPFQFSHQRSVVRQPRALIYAVKEGIQFSPRPEVGSSYMQKSVAGVWRASGWVGLRFHR